MSGVEKNISSRDGVTEKLLSIAGTCKDGQKNMEDKNVKIGQRTL